MSIRNRIEKLECQDISDGTGQIVFQTLFASDDIRAHITRGRGKSFTLEREENESLVEFEARAEDLSKLPSERVLEGRI